MDLIAYYSNTSTLVKDIRVGVKPVPADDEAAEKPSAPTKRRVAHLSVSARLTAEDRRALVANFEAGVPKKRLAAQYGISESSVKRLLRKSRDSSLGPS